MPCPRTGGVGQGQGPKKTPTKNSPAQTRARRKERVRGEEFRRARATKILRPDFHEKKFGFCPIYGAFYNVIIEFKQSPFGRFFGRIR